MPRTTRRFQWDPNATPEQIAAYIQALPQRQRIAALRAAGRPTTSSTDRAAAVAKLRKQATTDA